jgi:hypothetical protein
VAWSIQSFMASRDLIRLHYPIFEGLARGLEQFKTLEKAQTFAIIDAVAGRLERQAVKRERAAWRNKLAAAAEAAGTFEPLIARGSG